MQVRLLQLIILIICLSGCSGKKSPTVSFYVWKSKLTVQDADTTYLNRLGAKKIYVRMFDLSDKGNKAYPLADYSPSDIPTFTQEAIPVIFITNKTFLQCPTEAIESLAYRCANRMDSLYSRHFNKLPLGYQFDCDWTQKSRNNYFYFLECIKKLRKEKEISCTIRLHQIKFRDKTGIPPVEKGVLMYYASSQPTDFTNKNTILNNEEASLYIDNLDTYPLHLDVALPLYSWGIVRNPFGQIKLINGVSQADINIHPEFYSKKSENSYKILQSHYLRGMWINKGYELKVEEISPETLLEAAKTLNRKLKKEEREIIFYHLDEEIRHRYSTEQLTTIIQKLS